MSGNCLRDCFPALRIRAGPYVAQDLAQGVWGHEPAAARAPTGEYVLWWTASFGDQVRQLSAQPAFRRSYRPGVLHGAQSSSSCFPASKPERRSCGATRRDGDQVPCTRVQCDVCSAIMHVAGPPVPLDVACLRGDDDESNRLVL